ncbi:MAG TPA: hypothetical protein VMF52_03110 [Steroidobacteraceae bacterium]|nr:hypothetical protein [Steroidobacteraceae bacterium]
MNFQEKLVDVSAELRARATALSHTALDVVRARAAIAARRAEGLKGSFETLSAASRQLAGVARRHASRFVKENSALARAAGADVTVLARETYASLGKKKVVKAKARKAGATRKRTAKAA